MERLGTGAAGGVFRALLQSPRFLRSGMSFHEFYTDRSLLDAPRASLMPHEEPPEAILAELEPFLR